MFQQEFAERMAADPATDDYGRLSVTAGHYADVEVVETVPPEAFDPQPRVTSALVRTMPRTPDYTVPSDDFVMDFLKAVFAQRRKTMRYAVRNTALISGRGALTRGRGRRRRPTSARAGEAHTSRLRHAGDTRVEVGQPEA